MILVSSKYVIGLDVTSFLERVLVVADAGVVILVSLVVVVAVTLSLSVTLSVADTLSSIASAATVWLLVFMAIIVVVGPAILPLSVSDLSVLIFTSIVVIRLVMLLLVASAIASPSLLTFVVVLVVGLVCLRLVKPVEFVSISFSISWSESVASMSLVAVDCELRLADVLERAPSITVSVVTLLAYKFVGSVVVRLPGSWWGCPIDMVIMQHKNSW